MMPTLHMSFAPIQKCFHILRTAWVFGTGPKFKLHLQEIAIGYSEPEGFLQSERSCRLQL